MRTHDDVVARLMRRPAVRQEVERIERDQGALLDILLKARHVAGQSQAQVAERMGTQAPAVARLERALATGRHSPSLATLQIRAGLWQDALGQPFVVRNAIRQAVARAAPTHAGTRGDRTLSARRRCHHGPLLVRPALDDA